MGQKAMLIACYCFTLDEKRENDPLKDSFEDSLDGSWQHLLGTLS